MALPKHTELHYRIWHYFYYFYFPLPPIVTSLFSFIFPFSISFKAMVLLSQVLLVISIEMLIRKNAKQFSFYGFGAGLLYLLTESFSSGFSS